MAKESTARHRANKTANEQAGPKNELKIDKHNLEEEWAGQALLYYRYAHELAEARLTVDETKAELDVVAAELDSAIRAKPGKYGIERVSEGAIKNVVLQQGEHQKALEQYNEAAHAVRILEAMTRALEHRKRALTSMVELHLSNYFAEPTLPKDPQSKEAMEEYTKTSVRSRGRRRRGSS